LLLVFIAPPFFFSLLLPVLRCATLLGVNDKSSLHIALGFHGVLLSL
jgi:hypothetical protein